MLSFSSLQKPDLASLAFASSHCAIMLLPSHYEMLYTRMLNVLYGAGEKAELFGLQRFFWAHLYHGQLLGIINSMVSEHLGELFENRIWKLC